MNPRSLLISLGLHAFLGLFMIWASQAHEAKRIPLPEATVVKLIQPRSIEFPNPTEDFKLPAPDEAKQAPKEPEVKPEKKPPLEIPKKNLKEKAADLTHGSEGKTNNPPVPKELVGQGVTLKLNNSGFEYDFYLGLVQKKIEQNFRPPPGKSRLMAVVSFTILKSGEISDVQIVKPSGNLLIDQAAQRAVRAAGHFPPLPAQYGSNQLPINIEFVANPGSGG